MTDTKKLISEIVESLKKEWGDHALNPENNEGIEYAVNYIHKHKPQPVITTPYWKKNCESNRKRKCKCCSECPFRENIESNGIEVTK